MHASFNTGSARVESARNRAAADPHVTGKRIYWYGPLWRPMGYAMHNRQLVLRLLDRLPNMLLIPTQGLPGPPTAEHKRMLPRIVAPQHAKGADLVIQCTPSTQYRLEARYSVLITTIESVTPHPQLVKRMLIHDEVWLPCNWNKRILPEWIRQRPWKTGGPKSRTRPVYVMPEGADPSVFYPLSPAPRPYKGHEKLYTFHSDWQDRKGHRQLIRAWTRFQPDHPDAMLLLIAKLGMCTELEACMRMLEELRSLLPKGRTPQDYKIEILPNVIPDRDLNRIYNQTYCGVLPTRGEAWSLFPCQLAAAGRPTITTAYSGHLHYLNPRNAYLISVDSFGPINEGKLCAVDFYNYMTFPTASVDHLTALFQFTYNHPRHVEEKARRVYHDVTTRWTWDLAADKVYRRIAQLCRRLSTSSAQTVTQVRSF